MLGLLATDATVTPGTWVAWKFVGRSLKSGKNRERKDGPIRANRFADSRESPDSRESQPAPKYHTKGCSHSSAEREHFGSILAIS